MSSWMPRPNLSKLARLADCEPTALRRQLADSHPIVLAYWLKSSPVHLAFWCPWCETVHSHGAYGGDGRRGSHCHSKKSPLLGLGYHLFYAGTITSEKTLPRYSQ